MFNSPSGDKFNSFWRGRERKFLHMSQNVFMLHHCTHCLLCLVNNLHTILLEKRIIKIHDLFFLLIFSFIKNLIHIFLGVGFVGFVKNYIFQTFLNSFLSIASNLYIRWSLFDNHQMPVLTLQANFVTRIYIVEQHKKYNFF